MTFSNLSPSEFGKLFLMHRDSFITIARSYVRDQSTAEDIVSECFTTFWDKRESIEIQTTPEAYILKSVRNRCLNHLRDNARTVSSGNSADGDTSSRIHTILTEISILESGEMNSIYYSEVSKIFGKFLADMPDLQLGIFLSSRFEDLTYEKIALKYGVSQRKVKRDIQKTLEKLRSVLKDYLPIFLIMLSMSFRETDSKNLNESFVRQVSEIRLQRLSRY